MKINQYLLNSIKTHDNNILSKDSIFKGKVIDIFDSKVLLEVEGKSIIPAILDSDARVSIGDEMTFLVKSSNASEILIKSIGKEELQELKNLTTVKSDSSISNLLKNMNIEENKTSLEIVKNLIKSNIPLNKDSIGNSIKTLEKVVELTTLSDEDKVILLNHHKLEDLDKAIKSLQSNSSEEGSGIKKDLNLILENKDLNSKADKSNIKLTENKTFLDNKINEMENKGELNASIKDEIISLKYDLKNMIIVKENNNFKEKDISSNIKTILGQNQSINLRENLPRLVSLFTKYDIKANLNNIINMQELNQNPDLFIERLVSLTSFIKEEIGESLFKELFMSADNIDGDSSKDIKSEIAQFEKILEKSQSNTKLNIEKEIVELKNKNDFLNDINKNLLFTLIPINHGKQNIKGLINFIKKNKKKLNKEKTNVFINLNTKNLDNIRVSCHFANKNISIKIGIKKEYLSLFKENEEILIDKINALGYKVENVHYDFEEKIDIIDTINDSSKASSTYYLDVKV